MVPTHHYGFIFSGAFTYLILFSVASSNAADENRMEEARSYGRASLWTSVIGIIITAILGIILVIIYVTYWSKLEQDIENNLNDNYNSYNG